MNEKKKTSRVTRTRDSVWRRGPQLLASWCRDGRAYYCHVLVVFETLLLFFLFDSQSTTACRSRGTETTTSSSLLFRVPSFSIFHSPFFDTGSICPRHKVSKSRTSRSRVFPRVVKDNISFSFSEKLSFTSRAILELPKGKPVAREEKETMAIGRPRLKEAGSTL